MADRTVDGRLVDVRGEGAVSEPSASRPAASTIERLTSVAAIGLGAYHLYAAIFGAPAALLHRVVHFGGLSVIAYLTLAARPGRSGRGRLALVLSAAAAVASAVYLVAAYRGLMTRVGALGWLDLGFAGLGALVVLDLARRLHGAVLVVTALLFVAYGAFGPLVPGMLAHRGYGAADMLEFLYATTEGIFGVPLQVSATYIVVFILFAAFLERSGIARLFNDLAFAVAGTTRGGVAQVAVVSSALLGTINGSGLANVATTGAVTIPLMKRNGFQPHYAAAVEATASMGGQIMPPVMGVAAFLMAERLAVPYARIALAAVLPALLYYLATAAQIHFHAVRHRIAPPDGVPRRRVREILATEGYLLVPVAALIGLMMIGRSPLYAAVASIGVSLALGVVVAVAAAVRAAAGQRSAAFREALSAHGASPRAILDALEQGIRHTVPVAAACAVVGIVVGIVTLTGAGLKLSSAIVALAGGALMPTLVFTMLACFVLGMGLPTIPTYIITSTMAAPALVKLGVDRLAADFFVMYFGVLANLTPPVALAAYAAAGIAGADPLKTCFAAVRLSVAGFLVPYVFAYSPILLGVGFTPSGMAHAALTALAGVVALAAAMEGYFWREARWYERGLLVAAALVLIVPGLVTDLIGVALLGLVLVLQRWRTGRPA